MAGPFRHLLLLMFVLACCGPAEAGQSVPLPDGRHLYLNCTGQGAVTALLEGGFAADSSAWVDVQPVLEKTMRVCSYDRAGYGRSDMGPLPRDGRAVVKDLDQALRRAGIGGPFILVGHSVGALYVRLFAGLRPADVIGMVLADPSAPHQDKRFAAQFGKGSGSAAPLRAQAEICLAAAQKGALPSQDPPLRACAPDRKPETLRNARNLSTWRTQISEADTIWGATSDEIDAGRSSYGAMPLIVLTAAGGYANLPEPLRKAVRDLWRKLHDEMAALSTQGSQRTVSRSSHMMIFDRPEAITAAVSEIAARKRK